MNFLTLESHKAIVIGNLPRAPGMALLSFGHELPPGGAPLKTGRCQQVQS
jgi:hypothetical protein